ncbi:MAG: peroxiredoxin [Pseudorhodoplanes sp.]|jgi:peroxiredoxin Q/BCP|nr:peroxiredoxin [Pseudorhodoplanes sp.]
MPAPPRQGTKAGVKIGMLAPAFTLPEAGGGEVSLSDFKGRKLIVYFYPKADTEGCTREALDFTDLAKAFRKAGTDILGISADPVKKLDSFRNKHGLGISLASDEALTTLKAYGVWVEKSMYGRKFMGIERTTLLIGRDRKIERIWSKVRVAGHADEVLEAAKALK